MNRVLGRLLLATLPLLLLTAAPGGAAHADPQVVTVAAFTPPDLPEGLAVDAQGTVYVSMAPTGEIRRVALDGRASTLATVRPGAGFLLGLALDPAGDLYAALPSGNSPDSDAHGVWRIRRDGTKQLVAALPAGAFPNGLAFDRRGDLFVSDSVGGAVWRITPAGAVERWAEHPLLQGDETTCPPNPLPLVVGVNGLAFDRGGALVFANTLKATIGRIPVNADGSAGAPALLAGPDCARLKGADGLAFDGAGNLYVAVNLLNAVVRLTPAGRLEPVATAADGLDSPATLAFGTGRGQRDLYVTNFALLAALGGGTPRPSLMRIAGVGAGPAGLPRTGAGAGAPLTGLVAGLGTLLLGLALAARRWRYAS